MVNQEILNYIIIRKIGEGAMGQVFLARNKSIHQFVAIKMLHPQFSASPELRERFRQEAIMLSALDHPNIVKFLNYVENDQGIFLIMEYVDGMTLEDFILKKNGLIVENRAIPMMKQIVDAFLYAHGRGIIHRDIKPSNIFLSKDGHVKVLDFGIAQIVSDSDDRDLKGVGTISFMSPEQTLDRQLDIRSDIYSLGVVFYQMLTGRAPYDYNALSSFEIKEKIQTEPLPPMKSVYPYISDAIQAVVDRATAKNPASRYRNCMELRVDLSRLQPSKGNRPVRNSSSGIEAPAVAHNNKPARRNTAWIWIAASVVAVLAIGAGAYWWFSQRDVTRYFADYAEEWETPRGLMPLDQRGKASLKTFYKLEYSKGKVKRVSLVDSAGHVVAVPDSLLALVRFPDVEYLYDDNGDLKQKKVYNPDGSLKLTMNFESGYNKAVVVYEAVDSASSSVSGSGRMYYALAHNPESGLRTSAMMTDSVGEPVCSADSVYGYEYSYDKRGRINRLTYLAKDKKARVNSYGVAYLGYDYDDAGLLAASSSYDVNGRPVVPHLNVAASDPKPTKKSAKASKGSVWKVSRQDGSYDKSSKKQPVVKHVNPSDPRENVPEPNERYSDR